MTEFNKNHLWDGNLLINFNCHPLKACNFVKFNNHSFDNLSFSELNNMHSEERDNELHFFLFFVVVASDFLLMFLSCEKRTCLRATNFFFLSLSFFSLSYMPKFFKYILKDFLCLCIQLQIFLIYFTILRVIVAEEGIFLGFNILHGEMKKKEKSYYELPQADEREMKNHLFKHLAALETISDFFKFLQICRFIAKKQVPRMNSD